MNTSDDERGIQRLALFSDVVFAVVLATLILHVPVPPVYVASDELHDALGDAVTELLGFGVAAVVLGLLWQQHHKLFDRLRARDDLLLLGNLAFLICVAFLLYPSAVFYKHLGAPVAVLFFSASVTVTGLVWAAVWWRVSAAPALLSEPISQGQRRQVLLASLAIPIAFAMAAPLAPVVFTVRGSDFSLAIVGWMVLLPAARLAARSL